MIDNKIMSQPRANIYGFPHKGLRSAMSQMSKLSGNTDYSDAGSLEKLKTLTTEIVTLLDLHRHSEEDVVLPALEKKVPGSTAENVKEHEQIEKEIQAFDKQLKNVTVNSSPDLGAKFYEAVNNFYSKYIPHMAMEENEINPLIWANFTDEEVMAWHGQIMSTLTPDQIMLWFKYIVPALNPFERTMIMGGFKANAPAEFFDKVLHMLKEYMSENELLKLETTLTSSGNKK